MPYAHHHPRVDWSISLTRTSRIHPQHRLHAHLDILEKQFSRPTATGGRDGAALTSDGYTDFFAFSTGRRAIASLHTVFALRPRHDFFQFAFQFLWGLGDLLYSPTDDVTLDFKLHAATAASVPEFVWALVAKGEVNSIKKDRWDLVSRRSHFLFFPLPILPPMAMGSLKQSDY